jgi:hypothetical protein
MIRKLALTFVMLAIAAGTAAAAEHKPIGLGFHHPDVPIGGRWWINDTWGVDFGFGYVADLQNNVSVTGKTNTFQTYDFDLGAPYVLTKWDQVKVIARPGVFYEIKEDLPYFVDSDVVKWAHAWGFSAELEVEYFVAKNLSISGSTGIEYVSSTTNFLDPDFPDPENPTQVTNTFFSTTARDFTSIGFHVYLFGREKD